MVKEICRICQGNLDLILSLGEMPIVNYFPSKKEIQNKQKKYPLNLVICQNCGFVQLNKIIPPSKLFQEYHYLSSTSVPLRLHLESLGKTCIKKFKLKRNSFVMDIGCNDGVFLSYMASKNIKTLGIDPSKNAQKESKKRGVRVLRKFFNLKLSHDIVKKYGKPDLILATNTVAQIVDLHDFMKGIKNLLSKDGIFVVEVGYVLDMIRKKMFDSIYHEHFSYFSLEVLIDMFRKYDFEIFDAVKISNHGGSLRIFAKHKVNKKLLNSKRLKKLIAVEKKQSLNKLASYGKFIISTENFRHEFIKKLNDLRENNKSIIGWGAPAKSVIVLNYCNIDSSILNYIVDSTSYKQNRYIPGTDIEVFPEEKAFKDKNVDYIVLLAWTYKEELLRKIESLRKKGTKVILPFPQIKII